MIPMPVNPTVVIQRNINGKVVAVASNVAADLNVVMVDNDSDFNAEACNKPFNSKTMNSVGPVVAAAGCRTECGCKS